MATKPKANDPAAVQPALPNPDQLAPIGGPNGGGAPVGNSQQGQSLISVILLGKEKQSGELVPFIVDRLTGTTSLESAGIQQLGSGLITPALTTLFTAGTKYRDCFLSINNILDSAVLKYVRLECYHVRKGGSAVNPLAKYRKIYSGEDWYYKDFGMASGDTLQALCDAYNGLSWVLYGKQAS